MITTKEEYLDGVQRIKDLAAAYNQADDRWRELLRVRGQAYSSGDPDEAKDAWDSRMNAFLKVHEIFAEMNDWEDRQEPDPIRQQFGEYVEAVGNLAVVSSGELYDERSVVNGLVEVAELGANLFLRIGRLEESRE